MIIIAGEVSIQPEKREEALVVVQRYAAISQAEDGCLHYQFYSDLADPGTLFIFEKWASEEALAAHGSSDDMAWFRAQLPNFLAEPPALTRYSAEEAKA